MNKIILVMISIIVILGAMITAVVIYTPKEAQKETETEVTEISEEEILDECTDEYEAMQNELIATTVEEEKISPNAFLTKKITYTGCGHTTSQYSEIPEEMVNLTKTGLQEKYPEWTVEKFSDTEIILSKEEAGECGEHFVIRDEEGVIVIYEILENGTEKEYEKTDISTEYITETDKINLQNGVYINGKQELNQFIEDFE